MSTFIAWLKTIPAVIGLVDKFVEAWYSAQEAKDENNYAERARLRAFHTKKLKEAKTDEERINYHRTLHYVDIGKPMQ